MNKATLEKLAKNPHYKLTPEQEAELGSQNRQPMTAIGEFDRHNTDLPIHPTSPQVSQVNKRRKAKSE